MDRHNKLVCRCLESLAAEINFITVSYFREETETFSPDSVLSTPLNVLGVKTVNEATFGVVRSSAIIKHFS